MAEAGLSEPQTQAKVPEGQNGADRTNRGSSQSHNYSKDRQGNSSSSSKYRSKKDQLGRKEEGNVFDIKPKSKTRRSRQHAKEQEKLGSAFGEMRQSVRALEEDSKNDLKAREVIKGPVSTQQTSWHGKGNTKSQGNNQYQYGRGQRVDHYSSSKSRYARKHVNQTSISATSSQVPNLMAMDTQTPFESHGTVSDGIYVPKYKLENRAQGSQRKQFVSNDVVPNDESLASTHHRKGHLHSSREKSGYSNHLRGHANKKSPSRIGKLSANFQVFNLKSGGQSSVQAGVLIEQLTEEKYECMVCCEVIRCSKGIWSCSNCFHIFHLYCIKRWARSPASAIEDGEGKSCGWRCPACQFVERDVPNAYRCFCGKVEEPKWYPQDGITPHSCGELCLKKRIAKDCAHPCNQLCHPGPCPSCPVMITKDCSCGKTTTSVRCGNASDLTCSLTCGKTLNCGVHHCEEKCHAGTCEPCVALQEQSCYCGQNKTEAVCGTSFPTYIDGKAGYFSCGGVCSKKLDCGNHQCEKICHVDNCPGCELKPGVVVFCPCGKMRTAELLNGKERISCLDSIPTCGSTCDRFLPCAKYNDLTKGVSEHRCKKSCHHGDCSSCDGDSIVKCRCRATSKKTKCSELNLSDEPFMCERKCNKKFDCGRHRCSQKCCPGTEHNCTLICGKKLKCGKHKCMEPCHAGTCPPCLMAGFDEVFCPCGATVQEPPIPCGKLPPVCHRPCSRMHPCEHEVQHNCHYEEQCPPCTVLVSKLCMGEHKQRHNIPCHIESVSCGEQCGKPLQCGKHNCLKGCHRPPCLKEDENCKQPCVLARQSCGHLCGAPCHEGECPNIPCKSKVRIFCPCGRKSEDGVCLKGGDKMDAAKAYQRFTTKNLAEKIKGMQGGQSVDISGLMNLDERKSQLDCDSECARLQRNRALAEALGISRPETPEIVQYPHFLEEHGRANMKFVYLVENALDNLIKNVAKVQSQQLNHSFAPMNNKNRRFIHELATMYGCTSISYDQEPDRNTVVTANKESRCPRVKLSSQLQRQMNPQPPPPVPVLPEEGIGNVRFIERRQSPERDAVDYFADDF